ncbi:MAG: aldo/keto reductase [Clostridiales bacterium]|nr:aldo/keto reductase [Clostridiales bacterium]
MMTLRPLGKSGLCVFPLAFGTLTISPMQRDFPPEKGAELILYAAACGINLFDTAQLYDTYEPLRLALKKRPDLLVSTKSYAWDRATAQEAFDDARRRLDMDVIPIFLMHEQEDMLTLKGHREAFDFYLEQKAKGKIRAVGFSTHRVAAVDYAPRYPGLDIIHPLINRTGVGIPDGTRDDMAAAIARAHDAGIGIFAMKPLGGGHLLKSPAEAFDYLRGLDCIDAVCCGMQSQDEIDVNLRLMEGLDPDAAAAQRTQREPRRLIIHDWCRACGKCVERCRQGALSIQDGICVCDQQKCVRCGYCAPVCEEFCIKVI